MTAQPHQVSVGERIHLARRRKGVDVKDLAAIIGVHRNTIARWEHGDSEPGITQAFALAAILDVTVEDLVFGGDALPAEGDKPQLTSIPGGRRATDPPRRTLNFLTLA
jgi:transcriptional regulator with XRE-family HTH domain